MELIIERVVALVYLIIGLSYVFHNRMWMELSKELLEKPNSLLLWSIQWLPLGLIVILGHNLWVADWRILITLVGWLVTLKCVLNLLVPRWSGFVKKWSESFLRRYITVGGLVVAAVGVILTFMSFSIEYSSSRTHEIHSINN